jgi:type VI secretion system ImpB/VipA family protein
MPASPASVLEALEAAGVGIDAQAFADAVWLASHRFFPLPKQRVETGSLNTSISAAPPPSRPAPVHAARPGTVEPTVSMEARGSARAIPGSVQGTVPVLVPPRYGEVSGRVPKADEALAIVAPSGKALLGSIFLSRALRPFNRRVPARQQWQLDEEATVRRYAEDRLWVPVLRPAKARWLEVAIIVDAAPSMLLWQPVIREFRWILERQGAFRDVREWQLETMSIPLGLHRGLHAIPRRPEEVVDPAGRRLVLVVSDCVAPAWRRPELARWLGLWGRYQPVAIVQMLPERLWPATGLGVFRGVRLTAQEPGLPNSRLQTVLRRRRAEGRRLAGVPVPVVSLDPGEILDWAAMVAGETVRPAAAFLFPSTGPTFEAEVQPLPSDEAPEVAVARFQAEATQTAFRLACLLAAAPLRLPVMRLVQQIMLPGSTQGHLAEVFLSGLIRRVTPPDAAIGPDDLDFDFLPGVRELLLSSTYGSDALAVLRAVSRYFDEHLGTGLGFDALLANPAATAIRAESGGPSRVFARVSAQVLGRLGRRYAEAASRMAEEASESATGTGSQGQVPASGLAVEMKPELLDTASSMSRDELQAARGLLVSTLSAALTALPAVLAQRREWLRLQENAAEAMESARPAPRRGLAGSTILWVDDHPENNRNEVRLLEKSGSRIVQVLTSEDAVKRLNEGGIDAVLSDLARGDRRYAGLELLDTVRELGFFQPFAIYSAQKAETYQEQVVARLGLISTNRFNKILTALEAALGEQPIAGAYLPSKRVEMLVKRVEEWGGDPSLIRELNQQPQQPEAWARLWSKLLAGSHLNRVVEIVAMATGLQYVQLFRFENEQLRLLAEFIGPGLCRYEEASLSGIIGRAARMGTKVHLPDVTTDSDYIPAEQSTRSELAVPVHDPVSGRTVAVMNLESALLHAFGAAQIRWLECLAASLEPLTRRRAPPSASSAIRDLSITDEAVPGASIAVPVEAPASTKPTGRRTPPERLRVRIEYQIGLRGAEKKVELPFVIGVMADLSGKSNNALPEVKDRRFLEIDVHNFDDCLRASKPRVAFQVPCTLTGEGSMSVEMTFESMGDFSPDAVARKVDPLNKLLTARTQLANLIMLMNGKGGAEKLISKLLKNPALLQAVSAAPSPEGLGK